MNNIEGEYCVDELPDLEARLVARVHHPDVEML
jgi:hypothetical protein